MCRHPRKYLRPKWYLGLVPGGKDRSGLKKLGRERGEPLAGLCRQSPRYLGGGSRASWEETEETAEALRGCGRLVSAGKVARAGKTGLCEEGRRSLGGVKVVDFFLSEVAYRFLEPTLPLAFLFHLWGALTQLGLLLKLQKFSSGLENGLHWPTPNSITWKRRAQ